MFRINNDQQSRNTNPGPPGPIISGAGDGPAGIRVVFLPQDLSGNDLSGNLVDLDYNDLNGNFYDASGNDLSGNFYDASGNDLSGNDLSGEPLIPYCIQGGSNTMVFYIGLNTAPTNDVTITLTQHNNLVFNKTSFTFNSTNYKYAVPVLITSAIDSTEILETNPLDNVTLTASSDDTDYQGKEVTLKIETERLPKLIVTASKAVADISDKSFDLTIRSNKNINSTLELSLKENSKYLSLPEKVTLQNGSVTVEVTIESSFFDLKSFNDKVIEITITPDSTYIDFNTYTTFDSVDIKISLNKDTGALQVLGAIGSIVVIVAVINYVVQAANGKSKKSKKSKKANINDISKQLRQISDKLKNL